MTIAVSTSRRAINDVTGISATRATACLGAEVHGVDLGQPLSDAAFARLRELFFEHSVICLRGQRISPEEFAAFSARFGTLEIHHMTEHVMPHLPHVRVLSNVKQGGRSIGMTRGGMHWHSDLSYKPVPALATLLYGIECPPEGADTQFADMCAGYAALPAHIQALIRGKRGVHDRNFHYCALYPNRPALTAAQVASVPPVAHPLVRRHAVTGKISAFAARDLVSGIEGMDEAQARPLIEEIEATGTRREFVYSHQWQPHDILVWDNTCTLHRATPYDNKYNRTLYRTQVRGETPIPA